jgi:hypothetical protein
LRLLAKFETQKKGKSRSETKTTHSAWDTKWIGYFFTVPYPNPSKDFVFIKENMKDQLNNSNKISGELFDMTGQFKIKVQFIGNKAQFPVIGLKKGLYILRIYINDQVETHQIALE